MLTRRQLLATFESKFNIDDCRTMEIDFAASASSHFSENLFVPKTKILYFMVAGRRWITLNGHNGD